MNYLLISISIAVFINLAISLFQILKPKSMTQDEKDAFDTLNAKVDALGTSTNSLIALVDTFAGELQTIPTTDPDAVAAISAIGDKVDAQKAAIVAELTKVTPPAQS